MRRLIVGTFIGLLPLCLSASADEPPAPNAPRSVYVAFDLGIEMGTFEGSMAFTGGNASEGIAAFATLGAFVAPNVSVEGEFGYRQADVDFALSLPGTAAPGVEQMSAMVNVVYNLPVGAALSLTLGAGAGLDSASVDGGSETAFAYQFKGGIDYEIVDSVHIVATYRHMNTSADAVGGATLQVRDLDNSTLTLGLAFDL